MNYYPKTGKELKSLIDKYDAVSFDVWDTLITRTVLYPEDVFSIVESRAERMKISISDFNIHRRDAVFHVTCPNPNLTEIYDAIQNSAGISNEEKRILMELEIRVETEVILLRREMAEILRYAVEQGKKVSLITDMYLPAEIMSSLLKRVGITEYSNLFVSCDYRQLKIEELFSIYKKRVSANTYLHIGDNLKSDIEAAEKWGIDGVLIRKGNDLMRKSSFSKIFDKTETFNEKCMAGLFCAKLFNSPFVEEKMQISDVETLGWLFIAPIISVFMLWLEREMKKEHYDGLLFAARDGYLPQKLFQKIKKEHPYLELPDDMYLLTSRALCTQAGIEDEKDILWLSLVSFNGTVQELLRYRFCLEEKDILVTGDNNELSLTEQVLLHKEKIFSRASELRRNYLMYLKNIGIEAGNKYALFDFVSSGTCQHHLQKFVPFKLEGKYFCRSVITDERAGLNIDSLYLNTGVKQADNLIYENYRYLETIMTSPYPSFRYIDKNLNAVYDKEMRREEELHFVSQVHRAIEEYFDYFIAMCDQNESVSTDLAEMLYDYMKEKDLSITCKTLDNMRLYDDWVRGFSER